MLQVADDLKYKAEKSVRHGVRNVFKTYIGQQSLKALYYAIEAAESLLDAIDGNYFFIIRPAQS